MQGFSWHALCLSFPFCKVGEMIRGALGAVSPDCKMFSGKLVPVFGFHLHLQPLSPLC